MNIAELADRSMDFLRTLDERKQALAPTEFGWYPYGTMHNFPILNQLLTGNNRDFLKDTAQSGPIADIGAADGDTAFFLESLGYRMHAIDYAPTNYNSCRGIRLLKQSLASNVEILETDLDSQFTLPEHQYELVFFLGILYHLKNPYYVLESLAHRAPRTPCLHQHACDTLQHRKRGSKPVSRCQSRTRRDRQRTGGLSRRAR